jgi:hypothetical protein
VQIARGRSGGRGFRALAELKNMLAPAPLALHHNGIEGVFCLQHAHPGCPIPSLDIYGQLRPAVATLALSFAEGTRQAVAAVDVRRSLGLRRKLFVLASSKP